jgi:purine catabolism regulator
LRSFAKETVGPLIDYDKERGTELIKTLETYFECRGNLKQVAEKMYVHYNTVLYRLERIVQITNVNLDDAADNLNFQIGLKIIKILDI